MRYNNKKQRGYVQMRDYLYDMLQSFYDASEDGLVIYRDNLILYQNDAFMKITGSRLCITSVNETLGLELAYKIAKMLKNNRMCGINKCIVAGKVCKIRANKCGEDTAMVIHIITDFEKKSEEAQFALDSIFGISSAQNDAIMTANIAIDTISRKITDNDKIQSYLNSANRACLLAAKHNVTISELSSGSERSGGVCDTDRAINTVKKMCDILIGKSRLELCYQESEVCTVACNVYELENIVYSIISQLLRENPKPGKLKIKTENSENSVNIELESEKILWDKNNGGTDILRAENRVRVCGGKLSVEDGKRIVINMPKGKKQLIFKEDVQPHDDIKRALIELCEVI